MSLWMKSHGVTIQMKATEQYFPVVVASLSNDDGDVNENGKKSNRLFLYIYLPSLHDYDVKMPNFTFSGGRKHNTTTFFLLS